MFLDVIFLIFSFSHMRFSALAFPSIGILDDLLDDFAVHPLRLGFIKIMAHIYLGFIINGRNIPLDFVKQSKNPLFCNKHLTNGIRCSLENFAMLESNDKNDGGAIRRISIIPLYALSNLYNRSED